MTLYRIDEGRKATHIAIEAECVNHYDWNALHILHSRTEAVKTAEWYMTDGDITYTARGFRYSNREVMSDSYICYHINNEWIYLSEGEPVKVSDLRKADAIMAGGADDEMAWADDGERITVYMMDGDSLRVDIDVNELPDDCEAVNVSDLEERDMNELEIIRIKPTAQTAAAIAAQCNHYAHNTLKHCADAIITIIANPANDGRWTDADRVKDIIWEAYDELKNIAQKSGADMGEEWWKDARTLEAVSAETIPTTEAEPAPISNDERRAALDRLNHAQNAANLFTNISPADVDSAVMMDRANATTTATAYSRPAYDWTQDSDTANTTSGAGTPRTVQAG